MPDNGGPIPFDDPFADPNEPPRRPSDNRSGPGRPSRPLDDAPDELLEQARQRVRTRREEDHYDELGRKLARRILIAFVLIILTAAVFFVVLPGMGLRLPPIVPLACFATIAIGAVLTHLGDRPAPNPEPDGPIDIQAARRGRSLPPGNRLP